MLLNIPIIIVSLAVPLVTSHIFPVNSTARGKRQSQYICGTQDYKFYSDIRKLHCLV